MAGKVRECDCCVAISIRVNMKLEQTLLLDPGAEPTEGQR